MKKQYIILILMLFIGSVGIHGQTKSAFLSAAQNAYDNEDYYSAFSYYKEVLEFDIDDPQIYFEAAEAARKFNAYSYADSLYSMIIELENNNQFPTATFYAAETKQKLGQYDKAKEFYSLYLSEQGGEDVALTRRAEMAMDAIDWAIEEKENSGSDEDSIEHLEDVNTPYSEFGAFMLEDVLYFSSLRFETTEKDVYPDKLYSRILVSDEGQKGGELFGESLGHSTEHIAHSTFNEDHSKMYFTLCEYITVDDIRCDLYQVDFGEDGIEGTATMIQLNNSESSYTYTQPAWGYADDKEVLFFSSDMEGGKGGNDIWYIELNEDGSYGEPVNLQDINTPEDEITPFYDRDNNILYFSSEGYLGFGGFDIYSTQNSSEKWTTPLNVGYPLNSSFDDIYPMIDRETQKVYFSSNRPGSLYLDDELEGCCYDIYKGEIPYLKHKLIVQVFDGYTLDSVYGAEVNLLNAGNEVVMDSQQDDELAEYKFRIQRNKDYIIEGIKDGYRPGRTEFSTIDLPDTADIVRKVYLTTEELHLDVFVFDGVDSTALRGAEVTIIDDLGNTSEKINLDANDFHYELDRDRKYTFIVSRKGYSAVTFDIDPDNHPYESLIRKDVYLPMGTLKDFLPLVLYFDNDQPGPKSWAKKTDEKYTETFEPFFNRKDKFIEEFTTPLEGIENTDASRELNNFFETEVKKGNVDIKNFMVLLERSLEDGKNVEIYLKGYTSPRASAAYNLNLGMRRIQSVKNDLVEYNDGALNKYIKNGQLELRLKSFGKTTAPKDVVSDISDERNSIYSYKASKERRVEIIGINID